MESSLKAKRELVRYVNREANAGMDTDFFTLGFARRTRLTNGQIFSLPIWLN